MSKVELKIKQSSAVGFSSQDGYLTVSLDTSTDGFGDTVHRLVETAAILAGQKNKGLWMARLLTVAEPIHELNQLVRLIGQENQND